MAEAISIGIAVTEILSAGMPALFKLLKEVKLDMDIQSKKKHLQETIEQVEETRTRIENQFGTSHDVDFQLKKLEEVVYDVHNVLRIVEAEDNRRRSIQTFGPLRDYLSPLSHRRTSFLRDILERIAKIEKKIELIEKYQWSYSMGHDASEKEASDIPGSTTATLPDFAVHGRSKDVDDIVSLLTQEPQEKGSRSVSVVAICGMGGIGKTTLAQEVFNDRRVQERFELTMWVHVSRMFNIRTATKMILESACVADTVMPSLASSGQVENLDVLQRKLMKKLKGKRFLLVLDDMWTAKSDNWTEIKKPLLVGAQGSYVLVTARNEEVADLVRTGSEKYILQQLRSEDCRSIILEHAQRNGTKGRTPPDYYIDQLVKNCGGIPVIAMAYGNWLCDQENSTEEWEQVPDWKEVGDKDKIVERLKLSYRRLPAHLKKCFKYCAIFPDGHTFNRETMVLYWMAGDYIQDGGEYPEVKGQGYFDSLVRASLIQKVPGDPSKFVMHECFHELSRDLSGDLCFIFGHQEESSKRPDNPRHASFIYHHRSTDKAADASTLLSITSCSDLNTLILLEVGDNALREIGHFPRSLAEKLVCLHTLDLSYTGINSLDSVISYLRCLRFLNLCHTNISQLPKSLNELNGLQTLLLRNCYNLQSLPKHLGKLTNLRHLDLGHDEDFNPGCQSRQPLIRSMPKDIDKLAQLQTLSRFAVGAKQSYFPGLGKLNMLRGDLYISNLEMVPDFKKASEMDLVGKNRITRLKLQWSTQRAHTSLGCSMDDYILSDLEPSGELKELWIEGYLGVDLPRWIISKQQYTKLKRLTMYNCRNCRRIPSLVLLPSLEDLYVIGMDSILFWNCNQFCWKDGESEFSPSLRMLHLENMPNWKEWSRTTKCSFPCLSQLVLKNCPKLDKLAHGFRGLDSMVIKNCPNLLRLDGYDTLGSLVISNCPSLRALCSKESSQQLNWSSFHNLESLELAGVPSNDTAMKLDDCNSIIRLEISDLPNLPAFPHDWLPPNLTHLAVKKCNHLIELPNELCNLSSLVELKIEDCDKLCSLPENLKRLGQLKSLSLCNCPGISGLPLGGLPAKLRVFEIKNCTRMEECPKQHAGSDWEMLKTVEVLNINNDYYRFGEKQN